MDNGRCFSIELLATTMFACQARTIDGERGLAERKSLDHNLEARLKLPCRLDSPDVLSFPSLLLLDFPTISRCDMVHISHHVGTHSDCRIGRVSIVRMFNSHDEVLRIFVESRTYCLKTVPPIHSYTPSKSNAPLVETFIRTGSASAALFVPSHSP